MSSMAPAQRGFFGNLGEAVYQLAVAWGDVADFGLKAFGWLFRRPRTTNQLISIFFQIGVKSVPVVGITGLFIGMVLAVQSYGEFLRFPTMKGWMGAAINRSVICELGPVLAATMLAGRVGSAIAAELGTMRVTEQIDALTCLGVNPIQHLVVPRLLACVLLIPLLPILADFMGVIGGAFISTQHYGIDAHQYWSMSQKNIKLWDILVGLFKSCVFGATIAIISCHNGFNSTGGAEGVGKSATVAFVRSFVAILVLDFFLAMFFNTLYRQLWPKF
ncbi:MAG TPA: ABC transporter permease [Gemmatales bacterium]|nr:ABC transporter permease [Gemmatales bacterium]